VARARGDEPGLVPRGLCADDRDRLLRFVEHALAAERFDPAMGHEAMR
jgi:hypothetical protein